MLVLLCFLVQFSSTLYTQVNAVCQLYDTSTCLKCIPAYFVNSTSNNCSLCSDLIVGCLECTSQTYCAACQPGNDQVINSSTNATCVLSSIGTFYNSTSGGFSNCIPNCQRCPITSPLNCQQCFPGYFLNAPTGGTCVLLNTSTIQLNSTSTPQFILQYLLQVMPDFRKPIYNFELLSEACPNNGYSCMCNDNTTTTRCTVFNRSLASTAYNYLSSLTIDSSYIKPYKLSVQSQNNVISSTSSILGKLAPLSTPTPAITSLIGSTELLRDFMETISKVNYTAVNTQLSMLKTFMDTFVSSILSAITDFPPQSSFLLTGNQYIFKMSHYNATTSSIPSGFQYPSLGIVYDSPPLGFDYQLMVFDRSSLDTSFTGSLLTWNNFSASLGGKVTLPYLSSLSPVNTYQLISYPTGQVIPTPINLTTGLFSLELNSSQMLGIYSINSTSVINLDVHAGIRIQRLFYQSAILYILFFLLVYIIFIPICTFFDLCNDDKTRKRKQYTVRERGTIQDIMAAEENPPTSIEPSASQSEVNYKQFFPMYNIGATQNRPQRLNKLCLYILNLQNPTTFLVLLYSAVPQQAVWAILLAIPSYFLNVLAGYLYGLLKIYLRGRWKNSINIIAIGYWIIWYFLMPRFNNDFALYILIFSIILIVIDLVIDSLQCFTMYFIIKEQNPIYGCLAPILSKRGYFDYNKYASV